MQPVVKHVEPEVHLIARPQLDYDEIARYLADVGGSSWLERLDRGELDEVLNDPQNLAEFAGRLCYRSWEPGLNPNVTRVRTDQTAYLTNILASMHGSVLEHVSFSFVLHNVSRVATHELVRHRPGVAISQESLRFVRLTDLPFWFPEWAEEDPELMKRATDLLERMEEFQRWMADHFGLDEEGVPFAVKKHRTSFMRRFAPEGGDRTGVDGERVPPPHAGNADGSRRGRGDPADLPQDRRDHGAGSARLVRGLHGHGRRLGAEVAQGLIPRA